MSDEQNKPELPTSRSLRSLFPWTVLILVGGLLLGLNLFDDLLAEAFNLDPGVKHLATFILPLVALTLVGIWYLARHARSLNLKTLIATAAVLSPLIFFLLYQPIWGGNANLERFEARFWGGNNVIDVKLADSTTSRLMETGFDFPQFLGPDRDGAIENVTLALWDENPPELLWKQPVGDAWSGFVVVNGYAITQEQRDEMECVVCYEIETGQTVWNYSARRRYEDYSSFGRVGPRATPTIHQGRVYAVSGTGIVDCIDGEDGSLIWSVDVPTLMGIEQVEKTNSKGLALTQETSTLTWGRSQSPLVVENLLVVPGGGIATQPDPNSEFPDMRVESPGATLIALDLESGEEVWRGGDRSIAYGSPTLATIAGVEQILLVGEDHCVSHDPTSGKELWSFSWPGGSDGAANCSQVTVVDDQTLLLSKGYATGAQVIEIENDGGKLVPVAVAKDPRVLKTKFSSPVIYDGHAYSITDRFLECVDAKTLQKKWKRRGFGTGQLLLVGDKLLVHAESGKLVLVSASPDSYSELGSIETVKGTCWNTIAMYRDLVLVRSDKEAACFRLPIEGESPKEADSADPT